MKKILLSLLLFTSLTLAQFGAEFITATGTAGIGGIDSYTKLMLHMDGANGSTTFTDSELTPKTVTPAGNAQISTAQSKFGGASGLFDGTGDYLTVNSNLVATGNVNRPLSIEAWIYVTGFASYVDIVLQYNTNLAGDFVFNITDTGKLRLMRWTGTGTNVNFAIGTVTVPTSQWVHILAEWQANGTVIYGINGTIETLSTSSQTSSESAPKVIIGGDGDGFYNFNGYIDELRVSDNIVRWTTNFTPPTSPYSQ